MSLIKQTQELFGKGSVVALKGNHDTMFLSWLKIGDWLSLHNDWDLRNVKSFIGIEGDSLCYDGQGRIYDSSSLKDVTVKIRDKIMKDSKELLQWIEELPFYIEEENTLFVHAGFDEKSGRGWKESGENDMVWMYPAQLGKTPWDKVVVAGHIMTRELHEEWVPKEEENSIYRNGDHIYIDGAAPLTHHLNILMVDDKNKIYYDAYTGKKIV